MIIADLKATMRSVVAAAVIGSAAAFAPAALPTAGRAQGKCAAAPAPVPCAVGAMPAACGRIRELVRAALRATVPRQAVCERGRAQVRVTWFLADAGIAVARGPTMQAKSASVPFLMEPAKAAELSKLPGEQLSSARLCILPRAGALTTGLCKAHLAVTWT